MHSVCVFKWNKACRVTLVDEVSKQQSGASLKLKGINTITLINNNSVLKYNRVYLFTWEEDFRVILDRFYMYLFATSNRKFNVPASNSLVHELPHWSPFPRKSLT